MKPMFVVNLKNIFLHSHKMNKTTDRLKVYINKTCPYCISLSSQTIYSYWLKLKTVCFLLKRNDIY